MMLSRVLLVGLALGMYGCSTSSGQVEAQTSPAVSEKSSKGTPYITLPEVKQFIDYMVSKHRYDRKVLTKMFSQTYKREQVITKSDNQPEVITPYYKYRARFLDLVRVSEGAKFAKRNRQWLDKAEQEFGVDWPIIVALIGVETAYGKVTGNRDVFTSLTTLSFDYPRRAEYFRSELEAYLLLARQEGWVLGTTNGSYSGALGMVQFMPSNYAKLAVDYDNDDHIDLWKSEADAIGSIANYLRHHGWQHGVSAAISARVNSPEAVDELINKGRKPIHSMKEWADMGVWATTSYEAIPAGLVALKESETETGYWLAFENFFTIMDYNPSRRYAMSVLELANRVEQYAGN